MNRADLGTILTTLNMAAVKRSITLGELKAFIRSNIQQILNGVNNNLMAEKDGINYYFCATIDRLLDILNRTRKSRGKQEEFVVMYYRY